MYTSIVVGTDGSATARQAVNAAADLAERYGATLHVVCAHHGDPAAVTVISGMVPAMSTAEMTGAMEEMLAQTAAEVRRRGVEVETYACHGDPAGAIVGVAESQGAELVVVGNRGMTGARRFLGSVPNNVSHHARCSVLIVQTT